MITPDQGFAVAHGKVGNERVARRLRQFHLHALGHKDHDMSAPLAIGNILGRGVKIKTVMKHTFTGGQLHWQTDSSRFMRHLLARGLGYRFPGGFGLCPGRHLGRCCVHGRQQLHR